MAWGDTNVDTDNTPLYGTDPDQLRRKLFPGLEMQPAPQQPSWLPPLPAQAPAPPPPATPQVAQLPQQAAQPIPPPVPQAPPQSNPLAGVVPQPAASPNLQKDVVAGNVVQPQQADYKPVPLTKKQEILARVGAGLTGYRSPEAGAQQLDRALNAPSVKAQQAFQNDTNTFDKAMGRGVQAQAADREERNTESEIKLRDAQTANLANKPDQEDKKIDEGFNSKGERVVTFQKPDGSRYSEVNPQIVQPKTDKPDTANQDKQRYEGIIQARTMGQPVKPEDAAWAKAFEKASTLGPALNIAAQETRGASFGRNRPVQVIDTWNGNRPVFVSAGEAEDNPDRYASQSEGVKALGKQVTADDIQQALENVKQKIGILDNGIVHRAEVAAALSDPKSTAAQFATSPAAGQLSPQEQDYVISVLTAREVVGGLRNLLGTGTATDARVNAMLATLPGAKTPNAGYGRKQIDSALATLTRVRPAIPNVKPQNNPNQPPAGGAPQGKTGDPLGIF